MSIFNPNDRRNKVANASQEQNRSLYKAAIYPVDQSGKILQSSNLDIGIFLINPESWEERKSANWVMNENPGQSDPILQWVNSGPRKVTFTALVTADTSNNTFYNVKKEQQPYDICAEIAANFFQVSNLNKREVKTQDESVKANFDISNRLNFYRSLLYPTYNDAKNPTRLKSSPPLVTLWVGNTFSNIPYSDKIDVNSKVDLWVVTDLNIRITKQLSNLNPMEAEVTFELMQYTQKSVDRFYKYNF